MGIGIAQFTEGDCTGRRAFTLIGLAVLNFESGRNQLPPLQIDTSGYTWPSPVSYNTIGYATLFVHILPFVDAQSVAVEVLRAQLQAHLRAAAKVDRPIMTLGHEAHRLEGCYGTVDLVDRHDEIDVTGHHGLGRPVVHRDPADSAPVQFGAFQGVDHPHHVIGTARRLPIVELSPCLPRVYPARKLRTATTARVDAWVSFSGLRTSRRHLFPTSLIPAARVIGHGTAKYSQHAALVS